MNVFELYSGVGGMHFALLESQINADVILAADINTTANIVYHHNFPKTSLLQRNIQSLKTEDFDHVDMIMMSPPCQPFTRLGLQKDAQDNRSDSLLHIIQLIPRMKNLKYILLENVKGFETSQSRNQLLNSLNAANFHYQEFLLSPTSVHIPNSRQRYYLLAKKNTMAFCFQKKDGILEVLPLAGNEVNTQLEIMILKYKKLLHEDENCFRLSHILVDEVPNLVPEKVLLKHGMILDITTRDSTRSCCFTKGYSHYVEGTGSVFTPKSLEEVEDIYKKSIDQGRSLLKELELRFFSPKEVARLMCFPDHFSFPISLTEKQKYRLLGNSINVHVVALLVVLLVSNPDLNNG